MPRGVYPRRKKYFRGPKVMAKKPKPETKLIEFKPDLSVEKVATICELRDGTLFRTMYDDHTIYVKVETVCDSKGNIENVLVRRLAFFANDRWFMVSPQGWLENFNYLAEVKLSS